jgi:hypothetical protein
VPFISEIVVSILVPDSIHVIRVDQRSTESPGFSLGTPVSSRGEC